MDTTARYTHVATNLLRTVVSPLDRLTLSSLSSLVADDKHPLVPKGDPAR